MLNPSWQNAIDLYYRMFSAVPKKKKEKIQTPPVSAVMQKKAPFIVESLALQTVGIRIASLKKKAFALNYISRW